MPLEQIAFSTQQSFGIDIWAAGTIFYEFLTRKHPFFRNLRLRKTQYVDKTRRDIEIDYILSLVYELAYLFGKKKVREVLTLLGIYPNDIEWCETNIFMVI